MADDVEEPTGAADEAPDAPEDAQPQDTDVSDLPLDESPEAHIRRALAGDGEAGGSLDGGRLAPAAEEPAEARGGRAGRASSRTRPRLSARRTGRTRGRRPARGGAAAAGSAPRPGRRPVRAARSPRRRGAAAGRPGAAGGGRGRRGRGAGAGAGARAGAGRRRSGRGGARPARAQRRVLDPRRLGTPGGAQPGPGVGEPDRRAQRDEDAPLEADRRGQLGVARRARLVEHPVEDEHAGPGAGQAGSPSRRPPGGGTPGARPGRRAATSTALATSRTAASTKEKAPNALRV